MVVGRRFDNATSVNGFNAGTAFVQDYGYLPLASFIQPGPAGAVGATGATGAQGIQGAVGLPGQTGASGVQGVQGQTGATGATGPAGPAGLAGPAGGVSSAALVAIARGMDRLRNRFAEGVALAGSINVLPPDPGDRFAVSFGGAGYDGTGAGSVAVSVRIDESTLAYVGYARAPTQNLVKGGIGFSFR